MSTCRMAQGMAAAAADGTLSPTERAELEAHLQSCEACREFVAGERAVKACLGSRGDAPVPAGFAARVRALVTAAHDTSEPGWLGLANWRLWAEVAVPVAAALLAVVAFTGSSSTTRSTSTAASETGQAVVAYVTASEGDSATSALWRSDVSDEDVVAAMVGVSTTVSRGSGGSNGK